VTVRLLPDPPSKIPRAEITAEFAEEAVTLSPVAAVSASLTVKATGPRVLFFDVIWLAIVEMVGGPFGGIIANAGSAASRHRKAANTPG
jgi:hypothetical protein